MTDLRQAAQQAVEALEELDGLDTETECVTIDVGDVITALTAALEQQQAEPSQWREMVVVSLVREGVNKHKARELADHFTTPPQQQAEPISTHRITSWGHCGVCRHDRIPGEGCARQECPDSPQRKPLTDAEIDQLLPEIVSGGSFTVVTYGRAVARAIEAKLKGKNA